MSEINVFLKDGTYTSFSGVQFTDNYLKKTAQIYYGAKSCGFQSVTSKDVQKYMNSKHGYQESDIRTLISLLKKMGFINEFNNNTNGENLFTIEGELFVHIVNIKMNMDNTSPSFKSKINNAFSLLLQKGLIYAHANKVSLDIPNNFWLLIDLFKKLGTLSGKEYLYAISLCEQITIDEIVARIINNRGNNVEYNIYKYPDNNPIANTAYSYNMGLLEQANIITNLGNSYYKLINNVL